VGTFVSANGSQLLIMAAHQIPQDYPREGCHILVVFELEYSAILSLVTCVRHSSPRPALCMICVRLINLNPELPPVTILVNFNLKEVCFSWEGLPDTLDSGHFVAQPVLERYELPVLTTIAPMSLGGIGL